MLNEKQCWEMGKSQDEWGSKGMDIIPRKTSTEIGKKKERKNQKHQLVPTAMEKQKKKKKKKASQ